MEAEQEERCEKHQMVLGTCSICDGVSPPQNILSDAFDELAADELAADELAGTVTDNDPMETTSEDAPSTSSTATVLTRICENPDCTHGGVFQDMGQFQGDDVLCMDCRSATDLSEAKDSARKKSRENVSPKQRRWSDDEVEFLRLNVDKMSNFVLGESLGRTAGAVAARLVTHDIKRKKKPKVVPKKPEKTECDFDNKHYLGKVCKKHGHTYKDTGKSLRRKVSRVCVECNNMYKAERSANQVVLNFTDYPDLHAFLLKYASDSLRSPESQILWVLKRLHQLSSGDKEKA